MARILIARRCSATPGTEYYWDTDIHQAIGITVTSNTCSPYNVAPNTLVDSYCVGNTLTEARTWWDGTGRPPRVAADYIQYTETPNSASCGFVNPCNLSIVEVYVEEASQNVFRATIVASATTATLEYSLNNFVDVQASPVFDNLSAGTYIGYVRTK